jgi:hypothetical protein
MHHLRRPLEQSPATGRKKRIATKKRVAEQIGNVARRMAGDKENFAGELTDADFGSLVYAMGQAGNSTLVALMAVDIQFPSGQQPFVAAGVIAVMVRV